MMFVKPGPHPTEEGKSLRVHFPRSRQVLPEAGREVPRDHYWLRRLRDGDVVLAEKPPAENPVTEG